MRRARTNVRWAEEPGDTGREALRLLQLGQTEHITDAAWELVLAGRAVLRQDCQVGAPRGFQVLTPEQAARRP